ncbi:MAG: TIGR02444 family protein [Alphaproteobacteria bacterium]|nr:MAG: TIGR02444 family protein [Alphaproteobacteria bacterium]
MPSRGTARSIPTVRWCAPRAGWESASAMPEPGDTPPSANPFWAFSVDLYGRPGVAAACLALQDRRGVDVNLLLLCCWAAAHGRRLRREDLSRLDAHVAPWRDAVTRPLRAVRRWLKAPGDAPGAAARRLRARVQEDELAAEAIAQEMLVQALGTDVAKAPSAAPVASGDPALAAANLRACCFAMSGSLPDAADRRDLAVVLAAGWPDLTPAQVEALLTA